MLNIQQQINQEILKDVWRESLNCSMIVNYYASIVGTDWKIAQSTTLKS